MQPLPGQIVRVRSRQYLVEDVVPPPSPGDDLLVRMSCVDDDAQSEPLDVLWERELDAEVLTRTASSPRREAALDDPATFAAYLHALRWGCVTATDPKLFQAPYRAGIEVMAYQLEPLRKALQLPFVHLFVADDVGLGKTIEAGLVMRELMMRQKVRRIVVAAPPSVVPQWKDELERRFGLRFVVYDRDFVLARRRERGFGVNPFTTHSRFVISHALLRDETHASLLRDWITSDDHLHPEHREPALLVLDEAHAAAPASGAKYAIDSKLTRVVRDLAGLFEHRLFLSATPHNGHSNSFSALLEILDPHRFCRGVKAPAKHLDTVMVRRLKGDLRSIGQSFPDRKIVQIDVDGLPEDAPELTLPRLLDAYRALREAKVADQSKRARAAAGLVLVSLQKRLLSSIEAFACTLRVHRQTALRAKTVEPRRPSAQLELTPALLDAPGADDERGALPDDELRALDDAQIELATEAGGSLEERERQLLEDMARIADAARGEPDARVKHLVAWLQQHALEPDGRTWRQRRVLVFTEYGDTKRYLEEQLRSALADTDQAELRIATFHGGMDEERREEVKRAFNADPTTHPLRILIATDAAREGINLQNHCADLFHFDVPWNPSRLEQRNGRIDRKLQRSPEVRCHYFVHTQRPEDRVLATLVRKTKNVRDELGSLSEVLEARLATLLEGGLRRSETDQLTRDIEGASVDDFLARAVQEELEKAARKREKALAQEIEGLRDMMATAREALAFDEDAFRAALDAALGLAGARPLSARAGEPGVYDVTIAGTPLSDPSWAETLDTLRAPRGRDEPIWAWRKRAPIRPVVFRDVGSLDEATVHLHLEHRLVQRLLGRLSAQGFVHDDLARRAAVLSDDPIPRLVLLGRLSLYGERASRLHDEIVAVAARWIEPAARKKPLEPFGEQGKQRSLELVEQALAAARPVPSAAEARIAGSLDADAAALQPALEALAAERAELAIARLQARAVREAKDVREVLETQQARIRERLDDSETQLQLPFAADERRQLESDQRHWRKRLDELVRDLDAAPDHVRRTYDVKARRIEPIGLVLLWPGTG